MARVTGIGGVFFKTQDSDALLNWYEQHLGVRRSFPTGIVFKWRTAPSAEDSSPPAAERDASASAAAGTPGSTVLGLFSRDTTYFAPSRADYMINYRVDDLDGLLGQLRAAGVAVDDKREDSDFGRFAWITDPEGNRIELWEPPPGM